MNRYTITALALLISFVSITHGQETGSASRNETEEAPDRSSPNAIENTLQEVHVRTRRPEKYEHSMLDEDAIRKQTAPDTAELLKEVAGGHIADNGPISSQTQYRGLFGPRMNTRVNGMYINPGGPNWMDPPLHYAPQPLLEDLTVHRGVAPVSTGPESIGGYVNARTRQSEFTDTEQIRLKTDLSARGRSVDDGFSGGAFLSVANQNNRLHVYESTQVGDDLEFPDGTITPTEYERHTFGFGGGHKIGPHKIAVNIQKTGTNESGNPPLPMDIQFLDTHKGRLTYETTIGKTEINGTLSASNVNHEMDNFSLRPVPDLNASLNPGPAFDARDRRFVRAWSQGRGLNLEVSRPAGGGELTAGVDLHRSDHEMKVFDPDSSFFVNPFNDVERDRYSVFSEWNGSLSKNWSVRGGLRVTLVDMEAGRGNTGATIPNGGATPPPLATLRDRFNARDRTREDLIVGASLELTRELSDAASLSIDLGRKPRAPSYIERFTWVPIEATAGLGDGNNYVGNLGLDPEVAREIDVGLTWEDPDERFRLEPHLFYRDVKDYISGVPFDGTPSTVNTPVEVVSNVNGDNDPLRWENTDATFVGADASATYRVTEHWSVDGKISYVRGRNTDLDDDLWRIPPLNGTVGVTHKRDTWQVHLESEWAAAQDRISEIHVENEADTANDTTPGYGLIHIVGTWTPIENLTVTAGVQNLFDQSYRRHLSGFNRVAGSDVAQGDRLPGAGRNIFLSVDVTF